jgi:hypothetical protein
MKWFSWKSVRSRSSSNFEKCRVEIGVRKQSAIEPLEKRIALSYSATLSGATATLTGNTAGDTLIIVAFGGLLMHNRFQAGDPGFASDFDFNSSVGGVQSLAASAASAVTINSGGGNDTINLGTDTLAASALQAEFTITNTGADGDTLIVDDSACTLGNIINITSAGYAGTGIDVIVQGAGFNGGRLLKTGIGNDTINVRSVASFNTFGEEPVGVFAGAGNDFITVGSAGNSLDGFEQQVVFVDGGTGSDLLSINDQGDNTANSYEIVSGTVSRNSNVSIVTNETIETRLLNGSSQASTYQLAGLVGSVAIQAGVGDDIIDASGVIPTYSDTALSGGAGNDLLVGSNGPDTITGGPGMDAIFGLDGSDSFPWSSNDGNDLVEGGSGSDLFILNSLPTSEVFKLSSEETRLRVERDIGGVSLLIADTEELHLNLSSGSDMVTVENLGASGLRSLNVDLGVFDLAADKIVFEGSSLSDTVHVSSAADFGGTVVVEGLSVPAHITSASTTDKLIVNGNEGIDILSANSSARSLIDITLNGEPGAGFLGNRAFGSPTSYDAGKSPTAIAAGDLNGDGLPDLVVANAKAGASVLLGIGDGLFGSALNIVTGGKKPAGVLLGNFDADADLDLAVTHAGSGNVAVLSGNGDGTFGTPDLLSVAKGPNAIRAARIDGGATLDLIVASKSGRVSVLLGHGDGTFQSALQFSAGGLGSRDLAVTDFNLDGKMDIAVANQTSNNVGLLVGNGDGTFNSAQKLKVGIAPTALAAGDFDNDGAPDLVVAHAVSRFLSVLGGNGASTGVPQFDSPLKISYPGGKSPVSLASADLDDDGCLDLVVANQASGSISALIGIGNRTFALPVEYDLGNVPRLRTSAIAVVDLNQDGLSDLIAVNQQTNDVLVALRVG